MVCEECPVCLGKKVALPPRSYNQVQAGRKNEETCWWCGGKGEVLKQETTNFNLNKYWMIRDDENITNPGG